ncbi:hypothetical protein RB195_002508 [Necator americanus]|uniref:Uncharacterized protein n=1 Tax=Necator americanus TaxID=51031 RepID=A0ABR1DJE3_NECAM
MREIFDSKVDWKTPLDQKICDEWYKLCKEVDLATLSIPRYVLSPRVGDQKRFGCSQMQAGLQSRCVPSGTIPGPPAPFAARQRSRSIVNRSLDQLTITRSTKIGLSWLTDQTAATVPNPLVLSSRPLVSYQPKK